MKSNQIKNKGMNQNMVEKEMIEFIYMLYI